MARTANSHAQVSRNVEKRRQSKRIAEKNKSRMQQFVTLCDLIKNRAGTNKSRRNAIAGLEAALMSIMSKRQNQNPRPRRRRR